MSNQLSCPSCGAPVQVENRFTTMVKCSYCDGQLLLEGEQFEFKGEAKLTPTPTKLGLGYRGTIKDRNFRVLGHIRYDWGGGVWDEWYVLLNEEEAAWVSEDSGELTISRKLEVGDALPSYESIQVGNLVEFGEYRFMVTEKGDAKVEGFEGELPFVAKAGDPMKYVDGSMEGNVYSIEYEPEEILFFEGVPLLPEEISIEEND